MFNSMLCVSIFPQCVRYISSSLLSNIHLLSILRHITVKPVYHGPLHMARRLPRMTPYIYIFNMILVDSMGSVQTSIDFRMLLIVSKHMRKVMIRFQTSKLPFRFGGISLNHLPRNTSTRQRVKRPDSSKLTRRRQPIPIIPNNIMNPYFTKPCTSNLRSSLDFHFAVRVLVGRSRNSLKFYGLLNAVIRDGERQNRI